jgi:hypothetical protein
LIASAYLPAFFQVDYSEMYEKNRVSGGYPRVSGELLETLRKENAEEESNFLADLDMYHSVDNLKKGLEFIEKRREFIEKRQDSITVVKSTNEYYQRALLLTLVILKRLKRQFSLEQGAIDRAEQCLDWLCGCIKEASLDMKDDIVMQFGLFAWKVCLWLDIPCNDQSDAIACLEQEKATRICQLITRKTAGRKRALEEQ